MVRLDSPRWGIVFGNGYRSSTQVFNQYFDLFYNHGVIPTALLLVLLCFLFQQSIALAEVNQINEFCDNSFHCSVFFLPCYFADKPDVFIDLPVFIMHFLLLETNALRSKKGQ